MSYEPRALFGSTSAAAKSAGATVRRSLDFAGRSHRTEFFHYWLVSMLLGAIIGSGAQALLPWNQAAAVYVAIQMLMVVPYFALIARRFHDMGLTGWLALLLLPAAAMGLYSDYWYRFTPPDIMIAHAYPLGGGFELLALPGVCVVWVALIQDGQHEDNQFVVNPFL